MCSYKTLKNNKHGYVAQCKSCNHIKVAFGNIMLSLTPDQFSELTDTADMLYKDHQLYPFPDQKMVHISTTARFITMIFSLNELKEFRELLFEGRNKIQYNKLFVFNEN